MTLLRSAFLIISLAIVMAACSSPTPTNTVAPTTTQSPAAAATSRPDEFAVVRGIYAKECQTCHGETAQGGTPKVDGKTLKVPSLRTGHALNHSDKDFITQIGKGGDGMPAYEKKMTPEEIASMVRFIRKEFQGK